MKQALINFINALADKIKPCKHKWDEKYKYKQHIDDGWGGSDKFITIMMCCSKCGEFKKLDCK